MSKQLIQKAKILRVLSKLKKLFNLRGEINFF